MPATTTAPKKTTKAPFNISTSEEGSLSWVPNTRRTKVCVIWSCGDEFFFARAQIEDVVKLFSMKDLPTGTSMPLRKLDAMWDQEKERYIPRDSDEAFTRLMMSYKDPKRPFLEIERYGVTLDFKSFVAAWKTINK